MTQKLDDLLSGMATKGKEHPVREAGPAAVQVLEAPERPVRVPVAAREVRTGWGTRLLPSLKLYLKGEAATLSAEAGHNVAMEDITETLLRLMRDDPTLAARVRAEILKD